jgi:hypothetical protein
VTTSAELFWQQSARLFAGWRRRLDTEPNAVRREVTTYLRWLNRLEPIDEDAGAVREVLTEMALEMLIEAVLRK